MESNIKKPPKTNGLVGYGYGDGSDSDDKQVFYNKEFVNKCK